MRIIGVAPAQVGLWRDPGSPNKWAPFFRALNDHAEVVDVVQAPVPPVRSVRRAVTRATGGRVQLGSSWSASAFRARSRMLERRLAARDDFDFVFQLQTLHGPGTRLRPYAICTDSTNALLQRHDPAARHLAPESVREWQALEGQVARDAAFVFTWSEFARRSFVEDYGCEPDRVVVSGAGANMVLPEVPDRSALPPCALFVGYEFERKGGLALLEAWAEVERRVPGAELVIAGPETAVRSPARNVRWVGRASRATLARLYAEATAFVMPSLFEPFGLVFLEAMGQGLPVVASDCCAMPELVLHGVNGALAPPGDAVALRDALVAVLADPARAAAMGRAGHATVQHRHLWSHVGARLAAPLLAQGAGDVGLTA